MATKFQKWLHTIPAYQRLDRATTINGRSGLAGHVGMALLVVVVIIGWFHQ